MSIVAFLQHDALEPAAELTELVTQAQGVGAIVSFVGLVRATSSDGNTVEALVLDHHPTLTQKSLDNIASACGNRFDVSHVRIVHRCGTVQVGEPIVFAGAASLHRRAAFEAADYLMDRLKTEAMLWKREVGEAGSCWIEPADTDYAARERWD